MWLRACCVALCTRKRTKRHCVSWHIKIAAYGVKPPKQTQKQGSHGPSMDMPNSTVKVSTKHIQMLGLFEFLGSFGLFSRIISKVNMHSDMKRGTMAVFARKRGAAEMWTRFSCDQHGWFTDWVGHQVGSRLIFWSSAWDGFYCWLCMSIKLAEQQIIHRRP